VFRDEHRTLCAMGYLIASTGRTNIVDDVARHNNYAYIPQLAGDLRLQSWLDSTGLTVQEAARIQPAYGGPCLCPVSPPPSGSQASAEYFVASGIALGVNTFVSIRNLAPRDMTARQLRRNAITGLVTGSGQVVLGAFVLDRRGADLASGVANVAIGAAAIGTSAWRLRHLPPASVAARSVSLLPFLDADHRAGLIVSARM
jgi:hypothetical protein